MSYSKEENLKVAREAITHAREPNAYRRENLEHMQEALQKAGATLEDIGTNSEEVCSLRKLDYVEDARYFLDYARRQPIGRAQSLYDMERYRKQAGASYEEIGTTQKEIEELQKV
jgi:hypothetical protein